MTAGSHGNSREFEVAELFVIFSKLTLTLKYGDTDLGLVVGSGREYLTLFGRNRVYTSVRLLAKEVLYGFTDLGNTGRATDEKDFVKLILGKA